MIEQKKDGFTLIELLGILVLLAIIGLISFKVIDSSLKKGKKDAYEKQLKIIELSAHNWASDNLLDLPTLGNQAVISLMRLKMDGYIDTNISDPISGKCFPNDISIIIKNELNLNLSNNYSYSVDRTTIDSSKFGTGCDIYKDDDKTNIEPQITFFVAPQQIGINEISNVTITTNLPNLDVNYMDIVDSSGSPFTGAELTSLGTESYDSAKKTYSRKVEITNTSGVSGTIKLRIKEGAIKTEKYSSKQVYSPEITLISHSNVIDSENIYARVYCGSKSLTNLSATDIKTTIKEDGIAFSELKGDDIKKGVRCSVLVGGRENPYTSGDFNYQDFYVLSTSNFTGSEVTLISDKVLTEYSGTDYFVSTNDEGAFSMGEGLSNSLNNLIKNWNLLVPFSYSAKYYSYTKYNGTTFSCGEDITGPNPYTDIYTETDQELNIKIRLPYLSDFEVITDCASSGAPDITNCSIPNWLVEEDTYFAVWGKYIEGTNYDYGAGTCTKSNDVVALYGIGEAGVSHSTVPLKIRPVIQASLDSTSSMCKLADTVCCCQTGESCSCLYKSS